MKILETERLFLREFILGDTEFIIELLNSPGWIKYIGDRNVRTTDEAIAYLENGPIKSYALNGFGLCLVGVKENNTPIGMCGILKRDTLEKPDIGFAFLPRFCSNGYAYEATKAVLHSVLQKNKYDQIAAITLPGNGRSIGLLKKLHFRFEKKIIDNNEELELYSITAGELKKRLLNKN